MSEEFPKDPENEGWVLGWGVVRNTPWRFIGIYQSEDEAKSAASEAGDGYLVHHGSHKPGTDDFVWTS
ncbi:hypothetical protein [Pseudomonas glycinae]|uniref:hypothetical protein n=1 Tax=Pseudomonas glycinae TaxID=1785145 RepID=UPI001F3C514A|nr:hypothetical protein [Pseudomonas glycinae]